MDYRELLMSEDEKFNSKNTDSNEIEDSDFANTELARRMSNTPVGTEGYWADKEQDELAVISEDSTNKYEGIQTQIELGSFVASKGSIQEILNNIRANGDNDYQFTESDTVSNAANIAVIKSDIVDSQQQDASYTDILSDEKNSPETKFTSNVKFNTHSTISNEATDHTTDITDTSASGNLFESNANNEDINVRDGNATVSSGEGDDELSGGAGNDTIQGGAGDDAIEG
jgi:Ca2+-binding RTX toxin-like protein